MREVCARVIMAQEGGANATLDNVAAQLHPVLLFNLSDANLTAANLTELRHVPDEAELRHALGVFYLVLFSMFFAQMGLFLWRKKHKRSYELVTLLGLWLIPPIMSLHLHFWRFIVVRGGRATQRARAAALPAARPPPALTPARPARRSGPSTPA